MRHQSAPARLQFRRSIHGCTGMRRLDARRVRCGYDSGPGSSSIGSASSAIILHGARRHAASRMSCQSVTSSDDRLVVKNHDQGQRDRRLARRHRQDHDREDLAGPRAVVPAETDQLERNPLQHHLDRKEHHDQVPARQEAQHSQGESAAPISR